MENSNTEPQQDSGDDPGGRPSTAFTDLDQIAADLELARILQQQEQIFSLLSLNNNNNNDDDYSGDDHPHDASGEENDDRNSSDNDDDDDSDSDEAYDDDGDDLTYEELLALGDVVGTVSRGVPDDTMASLKSVNYKAGASIGDKCTVCQEEYEDGDTLTPLPCKHCYHAECISGWLKLNKVCPLCNTEVAPEGSIAPTEN